MPTAEELNQWQSKQRCLATATALERNGFRTIVCDDTQSAAAAILEEATEATSIGFGGSLTVAELGVSVALESRGKHLLNHGVPTLDPESKLALMREQQVCDLFITGANAITLDGRIVNVDGMGNRVAASIFGPKKILIVAGCNKLVDGGIDAALARIHAVAAPPNAYRLNKQTPCAKTGQCANCSSPDRICNVTVILEKRPSRSDICVILINQNLGL